MRLRIRYKKDRKKITGSTEGDNNGTRGERASH